MGYRGRLIFPFYCEISPLDIVASAADPDGAGTLTSGYDQDFRERVVLPTADRVGDTRRIEGAMYKIPGQFGSTDQFKRLQMASTGNLDGTGFTILFHFRDLENAGLVEVTTGTALIKIGDRLNAIYEIGSGVLIQKVPDMCVITEAQPIFGLRSTRNLLACTFKARDAGQG